MKCPNLQFIFCQIHFIHRIYSINTFKLQFINGKYLIGDFDTASRTQYILGFCICAQRIREDVLQLGRVSEKVKQIQILKSMHILRRFNDNPKSAIAIYAQPTRYEFSMPVHRDVIATLCFADYYLLASQIIHNWSSNGFNFKAVPRTSFSTYMEVNAANRFLYAKNCLHAFLKCISIYLLE